LVVEDSNMMRRVVSKALVDSGYEVMEAIDGLDAIEKYSSFCPDLTLMDINMPKMSGLDAIEKIKQTSPTANFIMLTSS
jgi:two-component system, chemotaxis family, chemotaxis protein CheY